MTDTTIQEKEHSEAFRGLRSVMNSSRTLDDFLDSTEEGIRKNSHGVSGLTGSGRRSLGKWWEYKHPKRQPINKKFEFQDELEQLKVRYLSHHATNRVQTVRVRNTNRILIFNSHGRLTKQPRYMKNLARKYRK